MRGRAGKGGAAVLPAARSKEGGGVRWMVRAHPRFRDSDGGEAIDRAGLQTYLAGLVARRVSGQVRLVRKQGTLSAQQDSDEKCVPEVVHQRPPCMPGAKHGQNGGAGQGRRKGGFSAVKWARHR